MICFISCSKLKAKKPCKAEQMYISPLFKKSLLYSKKLEPDAIYILSAKYGVLELNEKISPYNITLNNMTENKRKLWSLNVIKQLKEKQINFEKEKAVWLTGKNYNKYLLHFFKNNILPFKKLTLGQRLKFLNEELK